MFITHFVITNKVSKLCAVDNKAATEKRQIKIGSELVVIDGIKGDFSLFRVMINQAFKGYIQKRDGEYYRLDGSNRHDLIFARICYLMTRCAVSENY